MLDKYQETVGVGDMVCVAPSPFAAPSIHLKAGQYGRVTDVLAETWCAVKFDTEDKPWAVPGDSLYRVPEMSPTR